MPIIRMIPTDGNLREARAFVDSHTLEENRLDPSVFERAAAHIFLIQDVSDTTIGIIGYSYLATDNDEYDMPFPAKWQVDFLSLNEEVDYGDIFMLIRDTIKDKYDVDIFIDMAMVAEAFKDTVFNALVNNKFKRLNAEDSTIMFRKAK